MLDTKEFYDIMKSFEMTAKKVIRTGNQGFTKEPKDNWKRQQYYSDGMANEAFKLFLNGYSCAKCVYQN